MLAPVLQVIEWAYDEQMVGLKNRFPGLQYIRAKVHKWGLKNFVAAAAGGYVSRYCTLWHLLLFEKHAQ